MEASSPSDKNAHPQTHKIGPFAVPSWILFDWAAQPFYTLITTFLFAPYFVNVVVGNEVAGQTIWGYSLSIAGLCVAILSPILASVADVSGRRKPWIFAFFVLQMIAMTALWFAAPDSSSSLIMLLCIAFIISYICAECSIVFTNAMMAYLVPENQVGRLSGTGFAIGYLGGVMSLLIMLGLIIPDPKTGMTLLSIEPIFSLDLLMREADRLVGPFSALWYLIFGLPLFLFTPDLTGPRKPLFKAASEGLAMLKGTLQNLWRDHRNITIFFFARLFYIDGLTSVFAFGAIYATTIFAWGSIEQGLFGIILAIFGAIGAFIGGRFDDAIGPRRVLLITLCGLTLAVIGIISIDKNHIFFVFDIPAKEVGSGLFSSPGEQLYLAFAILVGLVFGPIYASSRSLLVRLAPKDQMTEFFGLFAFSGKVTSFLSPFVIGTVTYLSSSQQIGISMVLVFLTLGFVLLLWVKDR